MFFIALASIAGSLLGLASRLVDSSGDRIVDVARWWSRSIVAFAGVRVLVVFRGTLDPGVPYVFLSNHASSLDIWAVFIALPRRIRLVAKKQLARIPLFGWVMWAGRFIFIDRQNAVSARRSIEEAGHRIHGGVSVLLFPEGTRTRDGSLGTFKKGGFHLAMKAGVPIVPIAIRGSRRLMPRGSLLLRQGQIEVVVGQPIPTEGLTDADRPALIERVRGEVAGMLGEPDVSK
jgi:1-acyl-sn-glycerol-3-phosphate acyltransferase